MPQDRRHLGRPACHWWGAVQYVDARSPLQLHHVLHVAIGLRQFLARLHEVVAEQLKFSSKDKVPGSQSPLLMSYLQRT